MSVGKAGWMSVKKSTDLQKNEKNAAAGVQESAASPEKHDFVKWLAVFLVILLALYFYFVLADLSTAPQYVYSQF